MRRLASTRAIRFANRHLDFLLAAFFAIGLTVNVLTIAQREGPPLANAALVAVMGASLVWRRRAPLAVAAAVLTLAIVTTSFLTAVPHVALAIPMLMLVAYSLGALEERRRSVAGLVYGLVVVAGLSVLLDGLKDVVFPTIFFWFMPWFAGRTMRARLMLARAVAERTARLEAEREERARRAVADDRARIARELHDVVAHSLTVMVIQAGAARRIVEQDPRRAAGVARVIKQMSREALDEMRRLVGVMSPAGEAAALAPQPTMMHVDSLVIRARAAGLKVDLSIVGERPDLPPGVDTSAYRVVQEALMNTLKHAPGARASVVVTYGDELEIDVHDDGAVAAGAAADALAGGQGLVGMRERVALYGGAFEAGPREGGGFGVRAAFPLRERVPA